MNLVVWRSRGWAWLKKKKRRCNIKLVTSSLVSPGGSDSKESTCNAGDLGLIPGLGRSPGGGHGNPIPEFLPGESPWTEESGGLQSMVLQRVRHH